MKYPKLSALFGAAMSWFLGGPDGKGSLTTEQTASLEASEKKIGEMETEAAQLKADKDAQAIKITELNAKVTELTTQVSNLSNANATLITEKAELQKKVDAKPTGTATTVISKEDQEAKQAADGTLPKKNDYRSDVDAEADKLVASMDFKFK
jgi:hypothetical protein